jgi:hypothetical protein
MLSIIVLCLTLGVLSAIAGLLLQPPHSRDVRVIDHEIEEHAALQNEAHEAMNRSEVLEIGKKIKVLDWEKIMTGALVGLGVAGDGVREQLALFDEIVRQDELAKLKKKIQAKIDSNFEWGQFEAWWKNTSRKQTIEKSNGTMTYSHDDDLLQALLFNYRDYPSRDERVDWGWRSLLRRFYEDCDEEQWKMGDRPLGDWQPSDPRGPHT